MPGNAPGGEDDGVGARMPPLPIEQSDSGGGGEAWRGGAPGSWLRVLCLGGRPSPAPVSNYEVLIHDCSSRFGSSTIRLSDPRLRSRFPIWMILALVLLFVCGILVVFFLVPRGVGFGAAQFNVTTIYLNQTYSTYRLVVKIKIPIYNNNYMDAYLDGNVTMRFYRVEAGYQEIEKQLIPKRAKHVEITAIVDASFVPYEYIARVLDNCLNFPFELVFFVEGEFKAHCMGQVQHLPLNTYTFIKCPTLPPDGLPPENSVQTVPPSLPASASLGVVA
ncbi:unnamed protein product [Ostreobium quekettii]|uniref:Uncharacterized protein n=1 Tax=Ostreobium quekettii TaxID=121088 RepID=A0A8S1IYK8_9CHLO|nr:unnamed protein product [Ostreobium quekettii]|eukprot:evm.model.scf_1155.2 EVM.evm.TU.scf_1155.2   scf_1155:32740-38957(-)